MAHPSVFVVDDDEAVRESLDVLISLCGYAVECYESVDAFLDAFDPPRHGCLLLDLRMPGKSGIDLLRQLKSDGVHVPTIVLSGHGNDALYQTAVDHGAMGFLEKPFRPDRLRELIAKCVTTEQQAAQSP